jgi:hypothetical protein
VHHPGRTSVTLHTLHRPTTTLKLGQASLRCAMSQEPLVRISHSRTRMVHRRNNTTSVLPIFRTASAHQDQPRVTAPGHLTVTVTAHQRSKSRHSSAQPAQVEAHHEPFFTIGVNRAFGFLFISSKIAKRYQVSANTFHSQQAKFGVFTSHIRASDTDSVSWLPFERACCGREEIIRRQSDDPHMQHLERRFWVSECFDFAICHLSGGPFFFRGLFPFGRGVASA